MFQAHLWLYFLPWTMWHPPHRGHISTRPEAGHSTRREWRCQRCKKLWRGAMVCHGPMNSHLLMKVWLEIRIKVNVMVIMIYTNKPADIYVEPWISGMGLAMYGCLTASMDWSPPCPWVSATSAPSSWTIELPLLRLEAKHAGTNSASHRHKRRPKPPKTSDASSAGETLVELDLASTKKTLVPKTSAMAFEGHLSGFWHSVWHTFSHVIWHIFWNSIWHTFCH